MQPTISIRGLRLGLCCQFIRAPIRFSTTTAAALRRLPLVYDVHHHRCLPDGLDVKAATAAARATWNREPLFHLSSPIAGWRGPDPRRHHDYINPRDFPADWFGGPLTVEVEAKAKELAVARLRRALERRAP